jgi:hypothetical protein
MRVELERVPMLFMQFVNTAIARMHVEADRRADQRAEAMLKRLVQMLASTPRQEIGETLPSSGNCILPRDTMQKHLDRHENSQYRRHSQAGLISQNQEQGTIGQRS